MEFREITPCMLEELAALYVEAFNAPPWKDSWTIASASKRLGQFLSCESFFGLAAYQEGRLCGLILGCGEEFFDGPTFQIREFCTPSSLQGTGLGSQLLAQLEQRLKAAGVRRVTLWTMRHPKNEGFYQKRGYDSEDGLVMMEKSL